MTFHNTPNVSFELEVVIPANTTAVVYLPLFSQKNNIMLNNQSVKYRREGNFAVIDNVGSGKWKFNVE